MWDYRLQIKFSAFPDFQWIRSKMGVPCEYCWVVISWRESHNVRNIKIVPFTAIFPYFCPIHFSVFPVD